MSGAEREARRRHRRKAECEALQADNAVLIEALARISKMHPAGPGAGNVARAALTQVTRTSKTSV
jgi:DNA-directed RNA polymerase specialized sigma54-like protein